MKKNNKGITLIALIVTIIVLLILAGITVASLSGDNGLIDKTSEAQFRTEIAQYQEDLDLSIIKEEGKNKRGRTNKFNATSYDDIKKIIPSFHKKYENSLVIEEDKLVFKGNNKSLYKLALDMGLISSDDLLDDEILEELQPFITEWTVSANDTITIPIGGTCDCTVNYGDGTEVKISNQWDSNKSHTYTNAGTYTVTIKGKCTVFSTNGCNCKDKLTKIVQWGSTGFDYVRFLDCTNLKGPIPIPSKNSLKNTTSMYQLFLRCSNLDGEIPEKLFYGCNKVNSFTNAFNGCNNLTGNIPENLFKDCTDATEMNALFAGCSGLTGNIPENLFKNCTKITNVRELFLGCSKLTGTIPENLFKNNTEITNFWGTFHNCSSLTGELSENLFKNCTKASTFANTFTNCKGITGTIPENLFSNSSSLITSFNSTFYLCSGLKGNIPEKLFANCNEVTDISNTFLGCSKLEGNIPENLFKDCTKITNARETFCWCSGLTGEIPDNLFENNSLINIFSGTFSGCTKLTGNAPALWNRSNVTSSSNCFKDCRKLSNYNEIPKAWGGGGE